jgi:hypothetical protein
MEREARRFAVLAVMLVGIFASRLAVAEDRTKLATQLFELGIDEYKAKNYQSAASSMSKAYELNPRPDTLYALAQAERLANNCKDATLHYKMLLEQSKEQKTIDVVKANLELCEQAERGEKPTENIGLADAAKRDAPTIEYRTVYRTSTVQRSNKLATALFTVGGISLGGAGVMYFLSRSTRKDADRATSLEDYNDLYNRSTLERNIAYGAAGAGLVMVTWATIRVIRGGGKKVTREVALYPTRGGGMLAFSF